MVDLSPVHEARDKVTQASQAVAVTIRRRDKLVSERDAHLRTIAEIEAADHARAVEALALGVSPPEPNRGEARKLTNAQRAAKAAPDAIGIAEVDLATARAALGHAEATFAGAVWNAALAEQADARAALEVELAKLAGPLARLATVDRIRERFSTDALHLNNPGADRPWSGRVLVKNLVNGIPPRLRGNSLDFEEIQRNAIVLSREMIASIEGKDQSNAKRG